MPSRRWLAIAATALAIALPLAIGAYFYPPAWRAVTRQTVDDASGPPTIAVLSFANLSGDAKQDYFSDGITRDIIASLGRFSGLAVLANSATAKFKGSAADSADLRQKLGAHYVVVGSVRQNGDRIRVSVDLTDTDRSLQLWSRQFERELTDIFAVQDEITRDITGALAIKLTRIEQDRAFAKETERLDAYDCVLRGWALAFGDRANLLAARALFEKAIALDPRYAAAIAALGWTYHAEAASGWTEFAGDSLQRAEALASQALSLSPELADAHQLLGFVYLTLGEYDRAIVETRRAIEINPSDVYSYAALGTTLTYSGDSAGAIAAFEKARVFDPTLEWNLSSLGFAYYLAGRYDDAVAVLEPMARSASDHSTYAGLAAAYAELGRTPEAQRAAAEVKRLWPFFEIAQFVGQWKDEKSRQHIADGLTKAGLT